ncbi:MAG: AzlD domain-containing protein [Synergistaceae bacterium]|nr:AzlD domain-containing protein [Synergistaceae bacterium]
MDKTWWFIIGGMTAVTFLPRVIPILLLSDRKLPPAAERWLSLIAPAILSALLFPELLFVHGATPAVPLLASVPTFFVAWRTKSLFKTVITGIAAVALLRLITKLSFILPALLSLI